MTDPQIALLMLGIFIFIILLGFPIAFTLMAMGVGFGYYAYFDADRMWRSYHRAVESGADGWTLVETWIGGLFNNRIFDLFINQTFSVMANDVLTAARAMYQKEGFRLLSNSPRADFGPAVMSEDWELDL